MKGTVPYPKVENEEVACPKEGCGGAIRATKTDRTSTCGRCGTIVHFYRKRRMVVKMTYCSSSNGNGNDSHNHL